MKYGLIGEKLGHSFSPEIHAKIAPYSYELNELAPGEVESFIKQRDFCGINVTIPYKQTVIPFLDEIDARAQRIGAVNVVVNKNGRLCGYNTDYNGATALIRHAGIDIENKKVLILGTGGTSKTLRTVVTDMNAREIIGVSRRSGNGAVSYEEATTLHSDAQVIINTTPAGMYPNTDATPIDISAYPSLEGVVDVIFNPLSTPLVRSARARGIKAEGGLYMLVAQAVYASALFRGIEPDDGITASVYDELLKEKQNIVLIGMPSSGKTTVGGVLSEKLGRKIVDSDAEIVKRLGKPITEIFKEHGEPYFRQLESEVIADIAKKQGIVIATGGGAVLNGENIDKLKSNGRVYFLDRPLSLLIGTADRPLASDSEALKKRYEERYDKYIAAADVIIPGEKDVSSVAAEILKEFSR